MGNVSEETIWNCWRKTGILPSLSDEDRDNVSQIQQEMIDDEIADIDQIIREFNTDDPSATLLVNTLNHFFQKLEEIPTEEILDENDIIRLIQEEMRDENDDSEEEEILVSPGALKCLQTWITFFEQ